MHRNRVEKWVILLFAAVILTAPAILVVDSGQAAKQQSAPAASGLSDSDCSKCHVNAPQDILALGGAHRSAVGCMDCHQGHPPIVKNIIPSCGACHSGKSHYELENCLACHSNPHKPLELTLSGNLTDPCLTCHSGQIAQLQEHKSAHTKLACTNCHEKHAQAPDCLNCHASHSAEMAGPDCKSCHRAHMPLAVTYASNVPSKHCGACHDNAFNQLATKTTRHSKLGCAACHQEKHGTLMQCQECHGSPHAAGMMAKFPNCGACHGIAHDLMK
jgi:hypothetical protein